MCEHINKFEFDRHIHKYDKEETIKMRRPIKCPCKDCLTLAICRHRVLEEVLKICLAFKDYVVYRDYGSRFNEYSANHYNKRRLLKAEDILKPSRWRFRITGVKK